MDIKKKIIISGQKVHDVGYRPYLLGIAESMEIERFFVDNIFSDEKQVVYALINSSKENVDSFIEISSLKFPEQSIVEKVEVEDYKRDAF
jgi:acylphosphatase